MDSLKNSVAAASAIKREMEKISKFAKCKCSFCMSSAKITINYCAELLLPSLCVVVAVYFMGKVTSFSELKFSISLKESLFLEGWIFIV